MRFHALAVLAVTLGLAGSTRAGIDPKNFDLTAKPQDDFDLFANGGWKKANPVPAAYSRWGAFNEVDEFNKTALHTVLERAAKAEKPATLEKLVGDFYASGMDEAAIEKAGLKPLQPELERIAAIQDSAGVQAAIARWHALDVHVGFFFTSEQDPKNTAMMIAANGQAGLGLPDRDYYLRSDEKSQKLREDYLAHVARTLELGGDSPAAAKSAAAAILKLETALAKGSKTRVELRDPVANYHKLPLAEVQQLTPAFNWTAYFTALRIPAPDVMDVGQPDFLKAFNEQLAATPVSDWQVYLRWHLLRMASPYLGSAFVDQQFAFYGKTLTGTQELRERWKRVLETVDHSVGEALGQLYVKDYFPVESKARMLKLVENLRSALRDRLQTLEWMDAPTRAKALDKLNAFGVKIGYPDKWIDYSALRVDRDSYVGNVLRAREFNTRRELAKIGQPVDRLEWGMTPPTVNAYYNATMNEIVFPAGILQPPFFDAKADDAVNYGGIGAVIGHEMTHGFDDEGRQFAADGSLTDWWSKESADRFAERSKAIVSQFSGYVAIDDLHLNGELTQGENIADLGGLKISYAALQKALAGQSRTKIEGYSPEQRFFLSWATVWHSNIRDQQLRLQVNTDPHSPAKYRVNGPVSNLEEFYKAFEVPESAPMRRSAKDRVIIW
jgi:putative endopeptidase